MRHDRCLRTLRSPCAPPLDSAGDASSAEVGSGPARWNGSAALRPSDQSVLSQGSACELRQARADADSGLDEFRGDDAASWRVDYWDENLLEGRPPFDPLPQVVGITCTSRLRSGPSSWPTGIARGSKVILGGLHVLSCPEECAPHADALALGDGVQLWPRILTDIENGALKRALRGDV